MKILLELSQKENSFDNYAVESGLDAWINKKQPLRQKNANISKPLAQRPLTAQGKPPRAHKVSVKAQVQTEKATTSHTVPKSLPLPTISPVPQGIHTTLLHFIRPPILNDLKMRSKSLKEENNQRSSSENLHGSRDINLSFRRKMMKYKLLGGNALLKTYKTEGLKLITMPRPL